MPVFSISKIASFKSCPLQYKYEYIDDVEVEAETTVEAYLGQKVHEALEKLYRDRRHEKLLSLEELMEYFRRIWAEGWSEAIIIVKKDYTQENYRLMGERFLANYYNRHRPFDQGNVLGLETKEFLTLDPAGEYRFHVRIDRLVDMSDGLYEVHDYKTGSALPEQKELDADAQLAIYALWVKRRFRDFRKARLVWHFLAFDKEMDAIKTGEELEHIKEEILSRIKEIEAASEFPAIVSARCDWCIYRQICPMWRHGVHVEQLPQNEYLNDPGVKLVDEYVKAKSALDDLTAQAEEKLDKLREALIAFSQKEGASVVFGTENKITVKEQEAVKFPPKNTEQRERLVETLRQIGKWDEVADLDVHTLAKILKEKKWEEGELDVLRKFETIEKSYKLTVAKK